MLRWRKYGANDALTLLALSLFAFLPTFFIPFVHGDEAGWATLSRYAFSGDLYQTITDNKPPLLFQMHWLFSLGNHSRFAMRLLIVLWSWMGALAFKRILEFFLEERWAFWGAALFCLMIGVIENGAFSCERLYLPLLLLSVLIALTLAFKKNTSAELHLALSMMAGFFCGGRRLH